MMRYKIIYLVLLFVMLFVTETRGQSTLYQFDESAGRSTYDTLQSLKKMIGSGGGGGLPPGLLDQINNMQNQINSLQNDVSTINSALSFLNTEMQTKNIPDTLSVVAGSNLPANSICMLLNDGKIYHFNDLSAVKNKKGFATTKLLRPLHFERYATAYSYQYTPVFGYNKYTQTILYGSSGVEDSSTSASHSCFVKILSLQGFTSSTVYVPMQNAHSKISSFASVNNNSFFVGIIGSSGMLYRVVLTGNTPSISLVKNSGSSYGKVCEFGDGEHVMYIHCTTTGTTGELYDKSGNFIVTKSISSTSGSNFAGYDISMFTVTQNTIISYVPSSGLLIATTRTSNDFNVVTFGAVTGAYPSVIQENGTIYIKLVRPTNGGINVYSFNGSSFTLVENIATTFNHENFDSRYVHFGSYITSDYSRAWGVSSYYLHAYQNLHVLYNIGVYSPTLNENVFLDNYGYSFCHIPIYPGVFIEGEVSQTSNGSNIYQNSISLNLITYGRDDLISLVYLPQAVSANQNTTVWLPNKKIPVNLSNGFYYQADTLGSLTTTSTPFFAGIVKDGFLYFTPSF